MPTVNVPPKQFTACGDRDAEKLLARVLLEMKDTLSGTGLCVLLGGSYGRGDGGVRLDKENGILYNDLDFFVFAPNKSDGAEAILKAVAKQYEHELKVDVDFSRIMSVQDIKNNASRLMMQELKRGYHLVCGEDLLAEYLPELPSDRLPYSEACRLLLNRGMGLLLAGEKISGNSDDTDFILRNHCKAILGAGDAMLITNGLYRWKLDERLALIEKMEILTDEWKAYYREAVNFKRSPNRNQKPDMVQYWNGVRDFFRFAMRYCAGVEQSGDMIRGIYEKCSGERSLKNYMKYCIKTRVLPLTDWKMYTIPPVAGILPELYAALDQLPAELNKQGKLYRHWLIFN